MTFHLAAAAPLRPEAELLLCCARTCVDPVRARRIQALVQTDIDWSYLLRTALQHGTMPLLSQHLHALCRAATPQAIMEQLERHYRVNAMRNMSLLRASNQSSRSVCNSPVVSWEPPFSAEVDDA